MADNVKPRPIKGQDPTRLSFGKLMNLAADELERWLDGSRIIGQTVEVFDVETGTVSTKDNDAVTKEARPTRRQLSPAGSNRRQVFATKR